MDDTNGDVNSLSQALSCSTEPVVKKRRVQRTTPLCYSQWATFGHISLSVVEKTVIVDGIELNVKHINYELNLI